MLLLETAAEFFPVALLSFTMVDLTLNVSGAIKTLQPCLEQWGVCSGSFKHFPHRSSKFSWGPKDNEAAKLVTAQVIEQERVRLHATLSSYFIQPALGKTSAKFPWVLTLETWVNSRLLHSVLNWGQRAGTCLHPSSLPAKRSSIMPVLSSSRMSSRRPKSTFYLAFQSSDTSWNCRQSWG